MKICYAIPQKKQQSAHNRIVEGGTDIESGAGFYGQHAMMGSSKEYMQNLKQWLRDTADTPLEEMSDFFMKRLDDYEEHMSNWEESYRIFAENLPLRCENILDLGCGTGLELDKIWQINPQIEVTGVDLCADMLAKLLAKHHDKPLTTICEDYFQYDFGRGKWDTVISFESLHHFLPERKRALYRKIYESLKVGGIFLLGDYIASCDEEEALLRGVYLEKRKQSGIPDERFVHFDIPLTLEHETELIQGAGFVIEKVLDNPDGATLKKKKKKGQ